MLQKGLELSDNLIVCYAVFKSNTGRHSHLELPKIAKASLTMMGKVMFTLCNVLCKT